MLVINRAPVDTIEISLEKPYVHVFLTSIILSKVWSKTLNPRARLSWMNWISQRDSSKSWEI
ncbi:hypothetical protein SLEP1_g52798 [Rubroshorea leprosula]|uniref:Uncharacterized protein n=1 Tax=Rubroshorea leprosula TaxID=152421 RepID=A0AAV5MA38_9ROSI|nr:hypothetical protein SLEP1_g52798 [Rubroshorea leprosula]